MPQLTSQQRKNACAKAVANRKRRAEVLDMFAKGNCSCLSILNTREEALKRIKVFTLMKCAPGVGAIRARKAMKCLGIAESRRVGGLGYKQRDDLREWFKLHGMR